MDKHDGLTTESLTDDLYSAECSCGWESEECNTRAEADSALSLHYKASRPLLTNRNDR